MRFNKRIYYKLTRNLGYWPARERAVARKAIADVIQVPEAKEGQLIFVSKSTPEDSARAKAAQEKLAIGKVVTLAPISKWNTGISDSVVVDGEEVIKFRCSVGKGASKSINKMYGWKSGTVSFCAVADSKDKDGRPCQVVICVLDAVKGVQQDLVNVKLLPVPERKPARLSGRFGAPSVKAAEVPVAEEKTPARACKLSGRFGA